MSNLWNSNPERYSQPDYAREASRPARQSAPTPRAQSVAGIVAKAFADPIMCPECGMPDVREIVRYDNSGRRQVYYVDAYCPDCGWYEIDAEGGT